MGRKYTGETKGREGLFSKICYADLGHCWIFLFLVEGGEPPLQRKTYALLLGRKGVDREFLLFLLFLSCLKPKVILTANGVFGVAYSDPHR